MIKQIRGYTTALFFVMGSLFMDPDALNFLGTEKKLLASCRGAAAMRNCLQNKRPVPDSNQAPKIVEKTPLSMSLEKSTSEFMRFNELPTELRVQIYALMHDERATCTVLRNRKIAYRELELEPNGVLRTLCYEASSTYKDIV